MFPLVAPSELIAHMGGEIWLDALDGQWRDLGVRGYRCAPASSAELIVPDHVLVLYRGSTRVARRSLDTEEVEDLRAGDVSINEAAQPSSWQWDLTVEVLHIYLPPALLDRVANEAFGCARSVRLPSRLRVRDRRLADIGDELVEEVRLDLPRFRMSDVLPPSRLALHLVRHYAQIAAPLSRAASFDAERAEKVRVFIAANLGSPLPVAKLAKHVGLGIDHFARLFQTTFAMPPHRYVLLARVERAHELIADPRLRLADIAERCGFADQSHMTRCFKSRFGEAPDRWSVVASIPWHCLWRHG